MCLKKRNGEERHRCGLEREPPEEKGGGEKCGVRKRQRQRHTERENILEASREDLNEIFISFPHVSLQGCDFH